MPLFKASKNFDAISKGARKGDAAGAALATSRSGGRRRSRSTSRSDSDSDSGSGSEHSNDGSDSGSGASDSEDAEDAEDYCQGGYHVVKPLDVFAESRYTVAYKLGWGHFSTVWMVYDTVAKCSRALKIQKSAEKYIAAAKDEVRILQALTRSGDSAGIVGLVDDFFHSGPNGTHLCMVFELMGQSLLALIKFFNYEGIPKEFLTEIGTQCLVGLDHMHRACGYVHTDIKPENVLI